MPAHRRHPTGRRGRPGNPVERYGRAALVVFVAVELVAAVVFLRAGHDQWFWVDEWDFLSGRSPANLDDIMRPHYGHWVTIPFLLYRALYAVFGLTYLPFQVLSVACHLTVAALVRAVMRRARVGPWLATAFATLLALFGTGRDNIVWAFQIGFTGSLAFGLAFLLLADHDGPFDRRDAIGMACGVAAMACSTPGVLMVVVVGLAVLLRRGWRLAAVLTLPLAAVYLLWAIGWQERDQDLAPVGTGELMDFISTGFTGTYRSLGWWSVAGVALGGLTVVGVVVSRQRLRYRGWIRTAAAPSSLFLGGLLMLVVTGYARAGTYGPDRALESRYLYVVAAMFLPLIALAGQAIIERWPAATPVVFVLALVGLPGNVAAAGDRSPQALGEPDLILTVPRLPWAAEAPAGAQPGGPFTPDLTLGFLRDALADGKLPPPPSSDPADVARANFGLAFAPTAGRAPVLACRAVHGRLNVYLERGDRLSLDEQPGPLTIDAPGGPATETVNAALGVVLEVQVSYIHVTTTADATGKVRVCPAR